MDKQTAKEILSAYRPTGSDALDDNLAEALELAKRDPELKEWFDSQSAFDQQVSSSLNTIKGPEAGKKAILATALLDSLPEEEDTGYTSNKVVSVNWWRYIAVAAVLAFAGLFSFQQFNSQDPELGEIANASWLESVRLLADAALPLDKRGDQIETLQEWLSQNNAPNPSALPASLSHETKLAGCRVFDLPNGKKASLLCFTEGSQFVHVFVVKKSDLGNQPIIEQSWERKGDWNLFAWTEGDMLMTVASKMPADHITPMISRA